MAKLKKPTDVNFLSFQGGGGLGFAYLGAIQALEDLAVLPFGRTGSQLKGISGTSAGAITAMFLALGCGSKDLKAVFDNNIDFDSFYDPPVLGKGRGLLPNNYSAEVEMPGSKGQLRDVAKLILENKRRIESGSDDFRKMLSYSWLRSLDVRVSGAALILAMNTIGQLDVVKEMQSIPFLKKFSARFPEYMYSLIYDRGIFAGLAVRHYLRRQFRSFVARIPAWQRNPRLKDASTMTFSMLKDLTGVSLAVCATNISQKKSMVFSASGTPDFPVVEAVGMSACFPVVFKPIFIDAPWSDPVLGPLRGLWLDGGLLNNIPVHAFDKEARRSGQSGTATLPPGMLALRLVEGAPRSFEAYDDPSQDTLPLIGLLRDMFSTLMVPGREGQFLTVEERQQSIDLFTFDLSLFEFAPTQYKAKNPVDVARRTVLDYFRR
ncbi:MULTISPECIES: patatin-like phospholipase family protein [unclassified Mesorhizobium]|uniref:patatin-like phospholipase family protein n=1 Tax=unclassified Mesorhizobium TaxID=325217 RepID=UPI00333A1BD9